MVLLLKDNFIPKYSMVIQARLTTMTDIKNQKKK